MYKHLVSPCGSSAGLKSLKRYVTVLKENFKGYLLVGVVTLWESMI